jgi:hypothetical protein
MQRLLCVRCGDSIHPDTASRNNGLCVPCTRGNQLTIEERIERQRQEREERRAFFESPQYKYWRSVLSRVYDTPEGFESLSEGDRLYFLLSTLGGEVHNGGFDQFFSNSSGSRYAETIDALSSTGANATLGLLLEAKQHLFAQNDVPQDRVARFNLMASSSEDHPGYEATSKALDALDKKFYADSSDIDAALDQLAKKYSLYSDI